MATLETRATIRCPHCGFERDEEMPLDACQIVYHCSSCGNILRPKAGDCCVFCSYGSNPCPPKQEEQAK
ncbi:MAG TPA: GDCCVxC domain-containing (seleno)protein [Ktedonobacterales bacterium]|jgi:DNA-directed RNA polymerase subunit RPC12/RpoP